MFSANTNGLKIAVITLLISILSNTLKHQNKIILTPAGMSASNDFPTAGGTLSGNLITIFFLIKNSTISIVIRETIIAENNPVDPKLSILIVNLSFKVANKKQTSDMIVPVILSMLCILEKK